MAYTIWWDTEENPGLCINVTGQYDWNEIWEIMYKLNEMIDTVDHVVGLFFVNGEHMVRNMPPGLMTQTKSMSKLTHPRAGAAFFINPKPSMLDKMWNQLIVNLLPPSKQFYIVKTLEEARKTSVEHTRRRRVQSSGS